MEWSGPVAPWRPRGATRHAAFVAAATEVFLEHGYDGATLDEIVRRAGGSRATLHNQFGGKDGLFAAIIATLCAEMNATLAPSIDTKRGPRETLLAFGQVFMRVMLRPDSLGLYRIVIAEAGRFPALGEVVYRNGPQVAAERLAAYLAAGSKAGLFSRGDAELRARHFLEMIKGDLHFRALLGIDAPSAREIDRCVRAAVESFLDGIAARA
jgi:AcrR family transcriptional regulator